MLAGFPDDLADEGPSAGPASLVGLNIAREQGWTHEEYLAAVLGRQLASREANGAAATGYGGCLTSQKSGE